MTEFTLIAGLTSNFGIGFQNQLPWKKFTDDMKWFRQTTNNSTVVMGRNTWESIGLSALPNRRNIILSSRAHELNDNYINSLKVSTKTPANVFFLSSFHELTDFLDETYDLTERNKKVFIIGGSELYMTAIRHERCKSLLITHLKTKLPVDTFFPDIKQTEFLLKQVFQSNQKCEIVLHDDTIKEIIFDIVEYVPYAKNSLSNSLFKSVVEYTPFVGESGYLKALEYIMRHGEDRKDRTGVGTRALLGMNFRYDILNDGYPLLTTKKMFTRGIFEEALWFLSGSTNANILKEKNVRIWEGNSSRKFLDSRGLHHLPSGDIGPAYGFQFRHAGADYVDCLVDYTGQGVDQVTNVIDQLKNNPHSRRITINLWSVKDLDQMALPPCLFSYQFWKSEDKYLNLSLYQRSGDMGLGVPFNIASASLLMHIFGQLTELIPKQLVHTIGDAHIYTDHLEPLERQIKRTPRAFPKLKIIQRDQKCVEDFLASDFLVQGYQPYPGIKMKMAV